jgi:hypothetical protein
LIPTGFVRVAFAPGPVRSVITPTV